jgi:CO/xanthine dehydrogenase Mo-binding subunit
VALRVRNGLPAGGNRIRTIGPAPAKGSLGVANRRRRHERRSHLQVQARNGNACLSGCPQPFPSRRGTASSNPSSSSAESANHRFRDRLLTGVFPDGRYHLAVGSTEMGNGSVTAHRQIAAEVLGTRAGQIMRRIAPEPPFAPEQINGHSPCRGKQDRRLLGEKPACRRRGRPAPLPNPGQSRLRACRETLHLRIEVNR